MDKAARKKLAQYLEDNIPFDTLKEVGFFDFKTKKTHYSKIAKRICSFFGFKSIYEYRANLDKVCCHLSMGNDDDICGMEPGYGINIRPKVDLGNPIHWNILRVDEVDMISQDKWLN